MSKTKDDLKNFSEDERAAMKERILELRNKNDESVVLAKIADMEEPDKSIGEGIHTLMKEIAPELTPKTWYGMPAYFNKDGKAVCFFQSGHKYKSRYCTFGFQDSANLDEGNMWATGFAITEFTSEVEKKITDLVKKALG